MLEDTKQYAIHLDNLRIQYNVTEEDLAEGICSDRQYRRYITGKNTLLINKLILFCERLNISPTEFFYTYLANNEKEYNQLYQLYIEAQKCDFEILMEKCKNINTSRLISKQNRRFYDVIIEIAKYHNKREHINASYDNFKKIIGYPKCLNNKRFDFIDIVTLSYLGDIETRLDKSEVVEKLISILEDTSQLNLTFGSRQLLPSIYANSSLYLYKLNRFEESLKIAKEGISHSLKYNDFSDVYKLRYLISISLKRIGYINKAEIEAVKCYMSLLNLDNQFLLDLFTKKILKHFAAHPLDLMIKHRNAF